MRGKSNIGDDSSGAGSDLAAEKDGCVCGYERKPLFYHCRSMRKATLFQMRIICLRKKSALGPWHRMEIEAYDKLRGYVLPKL